jgi:hypothetical protein
VFSGWLQRHHPLAKEKILNRIRATHDGKLNSTTATSRIRGTGAAAAQWKTLFHACCRKHGLSSGTPVLNLAAFRRVTPGQGELF